MELKRNILEYERSTGRKLLGLRRLFNSAILEGGAKRKANDDSSPNKKANVKKHARSVNLPDLRVEIQTFLNQQHDGQEITNAIAKYLTTNFGLWNPKSSVPFELRKNQLISLQSLIMKWIQVTSDDKVYYVGRRTMQLKNGTIVNKNGLKRSDLARITLGEERYAPRQWQSVAIQAWKENWWQDLDTQITYIGRNGPLLLIRKYKCPEYDPDNHPEGTGIWDFETFDTIHDSFDVFVQKTANGREMCYKKQALGRWLRDHNTWPNTGEEIPRNILAEIRRQLGVNVPVEATTVRCGWIDREGGRNYRVLLPEQYRGHLPRNHYSAGFLHRVSDWDFDEAEDIPLSGPVRDRHNIDLTLHRE